MDTPDRPAPGSEGVERAASSPFRQRLRESRAGPGLQRCDILDLSGACKDGRAVAASAMSVATWRLSGLLRRATDIASRMSRHGRPVKPDGKRATADAGLREALERLPVAVVVLTADGEVVYANAEAAGLFGYRVEDLTGVPATLLFPELGVGDGLAMPSRSEARPPRAARTLIAQRCDGSEAPVAVTISACAFDGAPALFAAMVDASDRYEVHRSRQELAHLTRVSALGELAGSLAHELNQPLTAILSNAQAAQRFLDADPINLDEVRETLKDIVEDNCRAGEIIRKIRSLVRKGDMELQPLDMGGIVRDVTLLVHSDAIIRGVRTALDIADGLPAVQGDKVQLQQVVLNLLLNSFDAMQDCPPSERIASVQVRARPDGTVCIAVRDRGHGLTVDQIDKIFRPFFTSKPHGLGLGLSISRSIVVAHGGRMWAENNADRGAAFYVILPSESTAEPRCVPGQP